VRSLSDSVAATQTLGGGGGPRGEPRLHASEAAEKIDPEQVLRETLGAAIERHGQGAVLLCSFQKEESVLIDELLSLGGGSTPVRIVTIDTGVLFPETLQTWKRFEERFGIAVEVQDASNPNGAGGAGGPWTGPEHCCSVAKVAALARSLEGAGAWITGIRRSQGPTRAETQPIEDDPARGLTKYNPLSHWSDKDIWRRIHARQLPYHPLHDQGYDSIGCAPCTQPGSGRDGRWAGTEKTECGLHLDPAVVDPAAAPSADSDKPPR
jgi:phosphoadenosine phosphosulfate reductase